MRLDLFLKQTGIAKRRAFAKRLCDEGCVKVDKNLAKAGKEVQAGSEVEIRLRERVKTYRIIELPERHFTKQRAAECYELLSESSASTLSDAERQ